MSVASSTAWEVLKWVFRTPELFVRIRDTAMKRCLSSKPLALMGSEGRRKKTRIPHLRIDSVHQFHGKSNMMLRRRTRIVMPPAKKYMYFHGESFPWIWPRPQLTNGEKIETYPVQEYQALLKNQYLRKCDQDVKFGTPFEVIVRLSCTIRPTAVNTMSVIFNGIAHGFVKLHTTIIMNIGLIPASVKPRKNLWAYNPRKSWHAGVTINVMPHRMTTREATRSIGYRCAKKIAG